MRRMSALYIADDHAGSHLLCLAEAVEAADGIDAHTHLLGNRRKVFAALHLVVEALRRVHGRPHLGSFVVAVVSQLAVDLVAGIASVVVLATFTGSNFRVALVTGQREEVVIAGDILVAEVEEKGGIEGAPHRRVSKCRCEPVLRPVLPPRPMGSPARTTWFSFTNCFERCP